MIDVFGVLSTPMSDKILAEKVFLNPNPDPELVTRILTHLATKPNSPHEVKEFTLNRNSWSIKDILTTCLVWLKKKIVYKNKNCTNTSDV